jgi:hypothetical protein
MPPSITVRFGGNLDDLKKALAEGKVLVENTSSSIDKMASKLGGSKAIRDAETWAAAIRKLGDVSKLSARDQEQANRVMERAIQAFKNAGREIPADIQRIADATRKLPQAGKGIEGLSAKMVGLAAGIGAAVGTAALSGLRSLGGAIVDLAGNGVKLAGVASSFDKLSSSIGQSGDEMLRATKTATKGLIADLDIMAAANKAILLGLPVTADEMAVLGSTAITLGKAMKLGPTQAMEDLITALGRGSPLILDNLGLTVKVGEANEKYAKQIGKASSELTDAEKKLAFYNEAMRVAKQRVEDLGGVQLSLADQITRVKVSVRNFTDALGVAVASSPVMQEAFAGIGDGISNAFGDNQTARVQRLISLVNNLALVVVDVARGVVTAAGWMGRAWSGLELLFHGTMSVLTAGALGLFQILTKALELAAQLPQVGSAFQGAAWRARDMVNEVEGIQRSFHDQAQAALDGVAGNSAFQRSLDAASTALDGMRTRMVAAASQGVTSAEIAQRLTNSLDEQGNAAGGAGGAVDRYAQALLRAVDASAALVRAQHGSIQWLPTGGGVFMPEQSWAPAIPRGYLEGQERPTLPSTSLAGVQWVLPDIKPQLLDVGRQITGWTKDFFGQLPQTIIGALQGGGDLLKSVGSLFGAKLGEGISEKIAEWAKGLASQLGQWLGGALAAVIPGLGSLLGPALSWLGNTLFGPTANQRAGRAADQQLDAMRASLEATYGSLAEIERIGGPAGQALASVFYANRRGVDGLELANRYLEQFNAHLERNKQLQSDIAALPVDQLMPASLLEEISRNQGGLTDESKQAIGRYMQGQASYGASSIGKIAANAPITSAAGAAGIGAGVAGIFAEMQAQGMSGVEIAAQMGPAVEQLSAKFKEAGFSGGAAFDAIAKSMSYLSDKTVAPLLEGVSGVTGLMTSLANLGRLDQETFAGLSAEVAATHEKLTKAGKGGAQALQALAPDLQTIWELQQRFGYEVDDSTQKLIDQALASGKIGEEFKDPQEQMLGAIDQLIARMGEFINTILGVPDAAGEAGGKIADQFPDEIRIGVKFDIPDDILPGGGEIAGPGVPHMARGGIVTRPTFALIGEAGPEAVIPLNLDSARGTGKDDTQTVVNLLYAPISAMDSQDVQRAFERGGIRAFGQAVRFDAGHQADELGSILAALVKPRLSQAG